MKQSGEYCPVVVQVIDEEIKKRYGVDKPFLVQVWNTSGVLVFERALHRPCANWNIVKNVFLFQETEESEEVWMIKLRRDRVSSIYCIKIN